MNLLRRFSLTLLVSLTLLLSCEGEEDKFPDCSAVLCPPNSVLLDYQDPNGNPLINTVFVRDSFKLYNPTSTQYIRTLSSETDNRLLIRFDSILSGGTYFLELDTDEVDTLRFDYSTRETTCCFVYTLDSLRHNGDLISMPYPETIVLVRE